MTTSHVRRVLIAGAIAATGCLSSVVRAQGIPVYDAQNVVQAIATVGQLKEEVQQELQLYQSLSGTRGFGSLMSNPVLSNSLPSNWQSVYTAIQNGGYAGLTGGGQTLRSASGIYNCEDQSGIDQQVCQRALNKPFQDKAFGTQAYQTELQELDQIQGLMQQIDVTQDQKGISELQARIQIESTAVGNEMTKLQLFRMLADSEDRLIAGQQQELVLKRAGNTARLQDQMVPASFGN
ncbi:type IV secretion system protein [Burkholderia gladioli pv. gladioli]|uniref:Conjugal transfer protein TraF n=1 Tax=Burkholderia gladioli TaxID=28095 RepID=A0A095HBE8_BURGA|nr:type IV secretion system protein [Burkholderia gladioli]AJX00982.1 type IV secretion system s family protein [Burkholderia gladioli]ASD80031.1 conjugal transfer protein TraF [Burkholderia gladioli pv. gladioli]AWY54722.1 conjugal transfer protein TraF [Burkholderia gladioli pv. gladioli]KGC10939.1 type IV secretion system s family protein [Burkholderia gladioli]MDJ1160312.1 type IV secretion system protein [Burkholderia gladioli pv. gladioli]